MEWILFYYNSLPDIPQACPFFSNQIMHRDFLMCNPSNTGHYQYPKFETLSYDEGCHKKELRRFLKRSEPEKNVIFYTRHTNSKEGQSNKVIGYFKVGKCTADSSGFSASDVVLLSKEKAIPLDYQGRGVPVSWGNAPVKDRINDILRELIALPKNDDVSAQHQSETKDVMRMLSSKSGRKKMIDTCESCMSRTSCYWGKKPTSHREEVLEKLHGKKIPC